MSTASNQLRLQIVTPEARVFDGNAELVELPTIEGQLGIYPGHVGLIAALSAGEIRVHSADGVAQFVVLGGYVEIEPRLVSVLTLFASPEDEKVQIEEACRRAESALEMAENQPPAQMEDTLAMLRIDLERQKKARKPLRVERK